MTKLDTAGVTDVGLKRTNNEDAFIVMPVQRVLAVADGMGGAAAGEVASRIFVTVVRELFEASGDASEEFLYQMIQQVFNEANTRMIRHVSGKPSDAGMGCTAELLAFADGRYIIGHVGDSRIYLLRNGDLRQLTRDHSLVQMQIDSGIITPEEARVHPRKNVVLRAVGMEQDFTLDILRGNSLVGDTYLLCSDGLTDMVGDDMIQSILSSMDSIQQKAEKLVESAKGEGGRDNITVVLCQVMPP